MTPISVVIPAFGRPDSVRRAMLSATDQEGVEVEVLIVDDGSPTPLSKSMGEVPENVRIIRLDTNSGPGAARNFGASQASNSAIAFLDSDDSWAPAKLVRQEVLLAAGVGVVTDYSVRISGGRSSSVQIDAKRLSDVAYVYVAHPSSLLLTRTDFDRVGGFPEQRKCAEDWVLFTRLLRAGVDLAHVPEALTIYNWREGSATLDARVRVDHALGAMQLIVAEGSDHAENRKVVGVTTGRVAQMYANSGEGRQAVAFVRRAVSSGSAHGAFEALRVPYLALRGVTRRRFSARVE